MTNQTTQTNQANGNGKPNKPTHFASIRNGEGKWVSFEQIGVAWEKENGSFYIKLHGTQVVSAFSLYRMRDNDQQADTAIPEAGE